MHYTRATNALKAVVSRLLDFTNWSDGITKQEMVLDMATEAEINHNGFQTEATQM